VIRKIAPFHICLLKVRKRWLVTIPKEHEHDFTSISSSKGCKNEVGVKMWSMCLKINIQ
jgi:hypothetical protein